MVMDTLDFSNALHCLKAGQKLSRDIWGKGLHIQLSSCYPVDKFNTSLTIEHGKDAPVLAGQMLAHILCVRSGSKFHGEGYSDIIPYVATHEDLLADDWFVIE